MPSVLWHCLLGVRKSIWPVKKWVMTNEVRAWLSVWSKVQMICIWSSWCNAIPSALASLKCRCCSGKETINRCLFVCLSLMQIWHLMWPLLMCCLCLFWFRHRGTLYHSYLTVISAFSSNCQWLLLFQCYCLYSKSCDPVECRLTGDVMPPSWALPTVTAVNKLMA